MAGARIQLKRATAAAWAAANTVLYSGEIGLETDTSKFKIGNGSTAFNSLSYFNGNLSGSSLNDLADVTITSAADGDFLRWNGTAWINDAVNLSTDTIGSFVQSLVAGTGVTLSNNSGENATPTIAIGQDVSTSASVTFGQVTTTGNVTVGGNLTVSGTTTSINTSTLNIADNIVILNNDVTGDPSENAGIEVERGTLNNVVLRWNEIEDKWQITTDGNAYGTIATTTDISTAQTTTNNALDLKANLASPTFTGTVTVPTPIGNTDASTKAYVDSTASTTASNASTALTNHDADTTNIHGIADTSILVTTTGTQTLTNKTITSPSGLVKGDVGLGNADNTSDANKPVSTAGQTALDLKANLSSPTFTGTVVLPDNTVALGTKTTGDYVSSLVAGTGITLTNNSGETATPTVAIGQSVGTSASVTFANITATGTVTLAADPSSALQAVTKQYVDNVASGVHFHESVHAASITNLATIYNNGTSGVGATLTADTNRAFSVLDGESVVVGQRVLIKNQTDAKQNGIYTLTTNGSVSVPWVLTRATDADNSPVGELSNGDFCFIMGGTVNAGYGYINNSTANPIVIGTDNVTYTAFNAAQTLTNGSGINLVSNVLSVDTTTIQARVTDVSDTEIGYLNGVTSAIQTQIDTKAPIASPTFTGTVSGITATMVGLGSVDNTADTAKPVSTAQQTALDLKANLASPTLTGTPLAPTAVGGTNTTQIATTAFVATALSGASISALNDVADVTITSAANGDLLKWNGTAWVNAAGYALNTAVRDSLVQLYMEVI